MYLSFSFPDNSSERTGEHHEGSDDNSLHLDPDEGDEGKNKLPESTPVPRTSKCKKSPGNAVHERERRPRAHNLFLMWKMPKTLG